LKDQEITGTDVVAGNGNGVGGSSLLNWGGIASTYDRVSLFPICISSVTIDSFINFGIESRNELRRLGMEREGEVKNNAELSLPSSS
jgi:hypothetical protein